MTQVSEKEQRAADLLREAARSGRPCDPVRHLLPDGDIASAYRVQQANASAAISSGSRPVGHKIGLTSLAVQQQLGVDQPDFGVLFAETAFGEEIPIPAGSVLQPRIEAELALVLSRPLDCEQPTVADVLLATAFVVPALEIVGSRIADWDITIVDTIADNASSGAFVLGGPARRIEGLDLAGTHVVLRRGTQVAAEGDGRACLGHPLNAAVWLARRLIDLGTPLEAGSIILTGALLPMVPVSPGNCFEATFSCIGSVRATFES
jgi:2-keto-4-pentenoate hydratase